METLDTQKQWKTPAEVIANLREIADALPDAAPGKTALTYGGLRELLNAMKEPEESLKETVLNILNGYLDLYPKGDGLAAADLWRQVRIKHNAPLQEIEEVLTDMLKAGLIHSRRSGFTTYLPGAAQDENTASGFR